MFCQLYAGGSNEYFGNATKCYILAFKKKIPLNNYSLLNKIQKKEYDNIRTAASYLLTIPHIKERCNNLIDNLIKDEIVDRELAKVIQQDEEKSAKVSAIKEYNNLKNRIKQPGGDKNNPLFIQLSDTIAHKNAITPDTRHNSG